MNSFRSTCYSRYVTSGQGTAAGEPDPGQRPWYDHHYWPIFRGWKRDARIIELGCGSGELLAYLGERDFVNAAGIDVSAEQIERAGERGVAAETGDVMDFLRHRRDQYDHVLAVDLIEHFTKDELFVLIPLIHAALRPGGSLFVQTPNGAGLFAPQIIHGDLTHMTILSEESFQQLVRLHGFGAVEFSETGPVPQGVKGRIRHFLWFLFRSVFSFAKRCESGRWQQLWSANMICHCQRKAEAESPESQL
ncbi:MAG: class I SAM-dependent methyltransferase [Lentisphaeria bacterium]|nr:class I SAM-dependent methyltransferase [Lentisphaeria bacterium]